MSDPTMGEITFFLKFFGFGFAILVVLLSCLNLLIALLRRLVRRQVARTDLDLIGQEAVVVKTIRPKKPGQIRCQSPDGPKTADAVSNETIRAGSRIMITASEHGYFRVRRLDSENRPPLPEADSADRLAADPSPTLPKTLDQTDLPTDRNRS